MTTKTQERPQTAIVPAEDNDAPLKTLLSRDNVKKRFNEILGPRRGAQFISSVITVWSQSKNLQKCTPESILGAAAQAAALDLSIVPTIGHAAIVPYKELAQFQLMTRGIIQLAHRSAKYRRMHLAEVYDGQLIKYDDFTGIATLDANKKKSDKIVGFYFRFELTNGFVQEAYWSTPRCLAHGLKYSKSFGYGIGLWVDDPQIPKVKGEVDFKALKELISKGTAVVTHGSGTFAMCGKTVVKNTLSKWGPLSSDMMDAFTADQAAIMPDGKMEYIDAADVPDPTESAPMPKRLSEKKKEEVPVETKAAEWEGPATLLRIAGTEVGGKPTEVATFTIAGKEEKFYTSQREVVEAMRPYIGQADALHICSDTIAGKKWVSEFKIA